MRERRLLPPTMVTVRAVEVMGSLLLMDWRPKWSESPGRAALVVIAVIVLCVRLYCPVERSCETSTRRVRV